MIQRSQNYDFGGYRNLTIMLYFLTMDNLGYIFVEEAINGKLIRVKAVLIQLVVNVQ